MSDISQAYFDDKDIAPYHDNMYDSDGFTAQLQKEYNDRAEEEPINTDGYNGDGRSVSSSSDIEESFEVSSVADLYPELQAIKGLGRLGLASELQCFSVLPKLGDKLTIMLFSKKEVFENPWPLRSHD